MVMKHIPLEIYAIFSLKSLDKVCFRPLGGWHSTEVAFALLTQQPQVRFSAFPRIFLTIFSDKLFILDVAEINRRLFLECGKLENVDRTI